MKKKRKKKLTKKQRRERRNALILVGAILASLLSGAAIHGFYTAHKAKEAAVEQEAEAAGVSRPELDVELLSVNEYSRPGIPLEEVHGVVIHYTANPGTSAIANRNYFEGLQTSHITKASSHFIVGLEGEIVQCIPCSEISYASNQRNSDTISIECCIEDDTGKFNQATYASVIHLTAWLVQRYGLEVSDVIRHYDVTGKLCPKYYVENPDAWTQFLADVEAMVYQNIN